MAAYKRAQSASAGLEAIDRIQGVIFDVDGTLYNRNALRRRLVPRILAAHWSRPAIGFRVIRTIRAYRQAHEELRNTPFSSDLQLAATAVRCGYPVAKVRATVEQWFERAPLLLLPQCVYSAAPKFLQLLSELGISCGVVSDYPADAKLSAMGLKRFFSRSLSAAEVGRQKPDPIGLLTVAQEMGVAPGCTLCIGDRNLDLDAATKAGMQGFLVHGENSYSILYDCFAARKRPPEI